MVSDTLFEAISDIERYMKPPFQYAEAEKAIIEPLLDHMRTVLKYLDTPPGTEREPVTQNETGK